MSTFKLYSLECQRGTYCNFCLLFKYTVTFASGYFIIIISRLPSKILFYQLFTISPAAILEHWHPFVLHHWL